MAATACVCSLHLRAANITMIANCSLLPSKSSVTLRKEPDETAPVFVPVPISSSSGANNHILRKQFQRQSRLFLPTIRLSTLPMVSFTPLMFTPPCVRHQSLTSRVFLCVYICLPACVCALPVRLLARSVFSVFQLLA